MSRFVELYSLERNLAHLFVPSHARFRPVDGLRAFAVLWVILMHCLWFQYPFMTPSAFAAFFENAPRWIIAGPYGVDLFFVISGFLIACILMDECDRRGSIRLRRFYFRRFLKLMPAYIAAMGIYAFTLRINRSMLWTNLIYINNFVDGVKQAMPWTWSLAIEEQFYFTFPCFLIFVFYAVRPSRRTGLLCGVIGLSLFVRAFVIVRHGLYLPVPWSAGVTDANFLKWAEALYIKPHTRFGCLALGVLAAHLHRTGAARRFFESYPRAALVLLASSALVVAAIVAAPIHVAGPRWNGAASLLVLTSHTTAFGAAAAFVMLYSLYPVGRVARSLGACLSWRGLFPLAQLAYSAYLIHPIVLTILYVSLAHDLRKYPTILYFIAGPMLSFAAAAGLYLLVERPFMNLRDYRHAGKEGPVVHSAAAVSFRRAGILARLSALILAFLFCARAQTLDQAESLWKARRWSDANEVFKALAAKDPNNPDLKVRWGRFFMDHNQEQDANELFNEALALRQDHPGALLGLALLANENYETKAAEFARRALVADPKLAEARELLARFALEDGNTGLAAEEARQALALNPHSVQARAILAVMDWLSDKKETPWDPHDARGYETAAHFFTINRRYEEGIAYYRKAVEIDPQLFSARSRLGVNLMRLGREQEARRELQICYDNQYRDHFTNDTLTLLDSYKNYVAIRTPGAVLKLHSKEAEILKQYFEPEIEKVLAVYRQKYRVKLDRPVQVEVYPDHADFGVRAIGMPGVGALGVTFGYAIAMDSPSAHDPGDFHWASTLWHEMSHVFTLTMTNHRVPRWFTEGVAVHEETAASPEWGDRLAPEEIEAIKQKTLLPVAELDRGFVHPESPQQVVVSYFQAGRIVDYITNKWGWNSILAILNDFGAGLDTPSAVRKELKIEPAQFDREFLAALETDTADIVARFEEWREKARAMNEMARNDDYDGVIRIGTAIRDLYPDYVEKHSVYEALVFAYDGKGQKAEAIAELERYMKAGGRNPKLLKSLAARLEEQGRKKDAIAVLERLNYIYPMDDELHQRLGSLYLEASDGFSALRELKALVAHQPAEAARAHYDLARAYRMSRDSEKAMDELLAALEIAPGYRPAQKMLLELSEEAGNQLKDNQ